MKNFNLLCLLFVVIFVFFNVTGCDNKNNDNDVLFKSQVEFFNYLEFDTNAQISEIYEKHHRLGTIVFFKIGIDYEELLNAAGVITDDDYWDFYNSEIIRTESTKEYFQEVFIPLLDEDKRFDYDTIEKYGYIYRDYDGTTGQVFWYAVTDGVERWTWVGTVLPAGYSVENLKG